MPPATRVSKRATTACTAASYLVAVFVSEAWSSMEAKFRGQGRAGVTGKSHNTACTLKGTRSSQHGPTIGNTRGVRHGRGLDGRSNSRAPASTEPPEHSFRKMRARGRFQSTPPIGRGYERSPSAEIHRIATSLYTRVPSTIRELESSPAFGPSSVSPAHVDAGFDRQVVVRACV